MYHISQDKRSQKSAALICDGMLLCLKEKEFSQITVTDLWKASGVSRATFYRLFDNVTDVLSYQCEQVISSIIAALIVSPGNLSYKERTVTILSSSIQHHQLLSAVSTNNRLDIIYSALCKQIPVLHQIYQVDENNQNTVEEHFLHCVCSLISTTIDLWIRRGQKQTADELYQEFTQVVQKLDEVFGKSPNNPTF